MSELSELYYNAMVHGAEQERERIAKFLETHSVDWDCGHLEHEDDEFNEHYEKFGETEDHEYDEFAAHACVRMELANWIRTFS